MGIKGFFLFLKTKYPEICKSVETEAKGEKALKTERDDCDCDNLYIDMNEIVHKCTRGSKKKTEQFMVKSMFKTVERILSVARPKKLLFLAFDGVAPRAKMNQQRLRRFSRTDTKSDKFDGNNITPGTAFMTRLSQCFHHYVHRMMRENHQFDNVSIIVSDANVPGEGEHKITEFISHQRKMASHQCNTRHVLYGGDADLILLALATHEPNFQILREDSQHFTFVQIHVLRESIAREFPMSNFPFQYDLEKIVDDWVFLSLLLGNDFLPQLQPLNKLDNLLTNLVHFCKKVYKSSKGYLTDSGSINWDRVKQILHDLSQVEENNFKKPTPTKGGKRLKGNGENLVPITSTEPQAGPSNREETLHLEPQPGSSSSEVDADTVPPKVALKRRWDYDSSKKAIGYQEHKLNRSNPEHQSAVALEYAKGLIWVLQYYYRGVPSWKWYYPFNCSPFPSDFEHVTSFDTEFEMDTQPLRPLEQLLCIVPPWNSWLLPDSWATLMTDPESCMAGYFTKSLKDSILPLDEDRLKIAVKDLDKQLTAEEKRRNVVGQNQIFVGKLHKGYDFLRGVAGKIECGENLEAHNMQPSYFGGISGLVLAAENCVGAGETLERPVHWLEPLKDCHVVCVNYRNPQPDEQDVKSAALRLNDEVVASTPILVSSQSHLSDEVHYPEAGGSGQCGATNLVISAVDEKGVDED